MRLDEKNSRGLGLAPGPRTTHFPIVRGSAIAGPGWSAGDTRKPLRIRKLEVVVRVGIEPTTRGPWVLRPKSDLSLRAAAVR